MCQLENSGAGWNPKKTVLLIITLWTFLSGSQSEVDITQGDRATILWYNSSNTHSATFSFTFERLIGFYKGRGPSTWVAGLDCETQGWERSMCYQNWEAKGWRGYICVTTEYWGYHCDNWGAVGWNTGSDWGYRPKNALDRKDKNGKPLLTRMTLKEDNRKGEILRYILNIENPSPGDAGLYVLGVYRGGGWEGRRGHFYLKDMYKYASFQEKNSPSKTSLNPHMQTFQGMIGIADPTYKDTLAVETGYSSINLWLEWMRYSALQHNKSNCYVCGAARPHLGTVPLNLPHNIEECFLSLYTNIISKDTLCEEWKTRYPVITETPRSGEGITVYPGNYTCYRGESEGRFLGNFPKGYCSRYSNLTSDKLQNQSQSLSDVYWICGDRKIRSRLEGQWKGECALAKAIMGIHIIQEKPDFNDQKNIVNPHRKKRNAPIGSFDPHVYIDAIGVPRGVPDEFKARDQVAAGFESLLLFITVNKNVDWINYIYYNQQRFINYTRDALQGIAEQLQADSIMTFQNRMALDMLLAEKGGVCGMLKGTSTCCTYIPDNTGPDGRVTMAIKKLTDLSEELKNNSGIDNPWDQYFGWFKGWKQALMQILLILSILLIVIGVMVCCVIPCFHKLLGKGVDKLIMYETVIQAKSNSPENYARYLRKYRKKRKNHII